MAFKHILKQFTYNLIILLLFISLVGCDNTKPAISYQLIDMVQLDNSDTVEIEVKLFDKNDELTIDDKISFDVEVKDFNDHIVYQGIVGVDAENYEEYVLMIRLTIDDSTSTSNIGTLKFTANFTDNTKQSSTLDYELDCDDKFTQIFNYFAEHYTQTLDFYDSEYSAYRIGDMFEDSQGAYMLDVIESGKIYFQYGVTNDFTSEALVTVMLSFDFSETGVFNTRLVYHYSSDLGHIPTGTMSEFVYDESGFPAVVFDNTNIAESLELEFHQMIAFEIAEEAMYFFRNFIEENCGIYIN